MGECFAKASFTYNQIDKLLEKGKQSAESILLKHKNELELLANFLLENETIDGEEMVKLVLNQLLIALTLQSVNLVMMIGKLLNKYHDDRTYSCYCSLLF